MTPEPRVILLGLDGFPLHALSAERTPNLWALGGPDGPRFGKASLPASTYPGFASLLSGERPAVHGVWCTWTRHSPPAWAGAQQVAVPTLFDRCRAAGIPSAAICGDYLLHALLRTESADERWPIDGTPSATEDLDRSGYVTNQAVRPHLLRAVADPRLRFVFGQLNEADTFGHHFGPDHPRTLNCCSQTDAIVGEVCAALASTWASTLLLIVSDHDMAPPPHLPPIDLLTDARARVMVDEVWIDGGAALVSVRRDLSPWAVRAALLAVDDVTDVDELGPGVLVASATSGRSFGAHKGGFHGSTATARTLAFVGGGHPLADALRQGIRTRQPHLADWAAAVLQVFELTRSLSEVQC